MLLVRLRSEGKDGKDLAQMMYESFQENVEARVRGEGVKVCFLLRLVGPLHHQHTASFFHGVIMFKGNHSFVRTVHIVGVCQEKSRYDCVVGGGSW